MWHPAKGLNGIIHEKEHTYPRGPPPDPDDYLLGMSSVHHSSVSKIAIRAFLLTVSVKEDISDDCIKCLVKHIQASTVHAYVVTEHGESGKLHLHAVLLYKDPRDSKILQSNVWSRQVQKFHPTSIGKYAVKIQVCPGNKWYDEYLQKEQDCTVLLDTYDREAALTYFPLPAEQECLMAKAQSKGTACPWLEQDTIAWAGSTFENTPEGAHMYLNHRMYVLKNMVPIGDPRKITQKAFVYWRYRNNSISLTPREQSLHHELTSIDPYVGPTVFHHQAEGSPGDSKKLWKDKDFSVPSSI